MVKPTGFREYDARWWFGPRDQPDGRPGARPGPRHADPASSAASAISSPATTTAPIRPHQAGPGHRPDGGRLQGARHRPGCDADGLFRPVRPRRAVRGHGHRLAQRERLDRRQDGRPAPAHLRAGRDGPPEGDRARRPCSRPSGGGAYEFVDDVRERYIADLTDRPKLNRPLKVVCACGNGTAGAFAPQVLEADRLRGRPARLRARLHLPALQSEPGRHGDAARHARGGAGDTAPMSASASTATATAAAWSTMRARRSSPTRSASCSRATCRRCTRTRTFVVDVKSTGLFATDPVLHQERRQHRLLEDRPFLHQAPGHRARRASPASRSPAISSSTSRSAAAMTTASSPRSPSSTCSTAIPARSMADLKNALPKTWGSPTMSPHCDRRGEVRRRRRRW